MPVQVEPGATVVEVELRGSLTPAPVVATGGLTPVVDQVGLSTSLTPVVGLGTSLTPVVDQEGLSTSLTPVVGLGTSLTPVVDQVGLSTSLTPVVGLGTSLTPVACS